MLLCLLYVHIWPFLCVDLFLHLIISVCPVYFVACPSIVFTYPFVCLSFCPHLAVLICPLLFCFFLFLSQLLSVFHTYLIVFVCPLLVPCVSRLVHTCVLCPVGLSNSSLSNISNLDYLRVHLFALSLSVSVRLLTVISHFLV